MPIGRGKLKEAYINSDLAYALWLTTNSITRATKRLVDEGIRNPLTGNPPCRMGVWSSATRSPFYKKYIEDRKSGVIVSEKPTKEEFAQARELIDKLLEAEKAKNIETLKQYGRA